MSQSVSAMEMRQKLGEMLSRVSLRHEEIIIERAGKKVARLLPVEEQTRKSGGKLDHQLYRINHPASPARQSAATPRISLSFRWI